MSSFFPTTTGYFSNVFSALQGKLEIVKSSPLSNTTQSSNDVYVPGAARQKRNTYSSNSAYTSTASNLIQSAIAGTLPINYIPPADDFCIPGTEGQMFDRFTIYQPTSGGRINYKTGQFEQGYLAITMIAGENTQPTNNNGSNIVTLAEIDREAPGAFFIDGKWTLVKDFFKNETASTPNESTAQAASIISDESDSVVKPAGSPIDIRIGLDYSEIVNESSGIKKVDPSTLSFLPLTPFQRTQLGENPGLIWSFSQENKAFENHDILNGIFDKVFTDPKSLEVKTDEYGYKYIVPGIYDAGENRFGMGLIEDENGNQQSTILSQDMLSCSFGGLTLDERDVFWSEMQKIFDQNGLKLDARKEDYGYTSTDEPGCDTEFAIGGWTWNNTAVDRKTVQSIQKQIADSGTLRSLFNKSEQLRKGEIADDTLAQQYSIRVTDLEGNALAKDRIIIESKNGNSIEMAVNEFTKLGRKEITAMLK